MLFTTQDWAKYCHRPKLSLVLWAATSMLLMIVCKSWSHGSASSCRDQRTASIASANFIVPMLRAHKNLNVFGFVKQQSFPNRKKIYMSTFSNEFICWGRDWSFSLKLGLLFGASRSAPFLSIWRILRILSFHIQMYSFKLGVFPPLKLHGNTRKMFQVFVIIALMWGVVVIRTPFMRGVCWYRIYVRSLLQRRCLVFDVIAAICADNFSRKCHTT